MNDQAHHEMRLRIGAMFRDVKNRRQMTLETLADELEVTRMQAQRLLNVPHQHGTSIRLRTLIKAAESLGGTLKITWDEEPW